MPYGFDWADGGANDGAADDPGWLQGDTISTSTWTITGPDSALEIDDDNKAATSTNVELSGGTAGKTYTVTNRIVTATNGYQDDRSIDVKVVQR